MNRTLWLVAIGAALALAAVLVMDAARKGGAATTAPQPVTATAPAAPAAVQRPAVVVYKNPSCTCCTKWIEHMERAGFQVTAHDVDNVGPIKRQHGVPQPLESCHTAIVGDYIVEGHVPADVVDRMLRERPAIAGIAVAGMPTGAPGMEGPNPQRYDVMAFLREGGWSVYERR
jgi:hypothetical protein